MSWNNILCWIEAHPGLSSWIQAFGSIAAIIVAIVLSGRESRYRLTMEKAARANELLRAINGVSQAKTRLEEILHEWGGSLLTRAAIQIFIGSVNETLAQVRALQDSSGEHDIAQLLGDARREIERAGQRLRMESEHVDNELFYRPILQGCISRLETHLKLFESMKPKPQGIALMKKWIAERASS